MYEAYYRFSRPPFSLTPDPEFLFKSQSHQAALEQLLRGIRRREGLLLLTADIGTGKTTIWRAVIEQLGPKTFAAVVRNSFSSEEELLLAMLQDFGVVSPADVHQGRLSGASKQQLVDTLNDFLRSLTPLGASAVLVIDEAQKLTPPLLEQLRVLTKRDTDQDRPLQVLLVGQLETQSLLGAPGMRALHQRVSRRCTLEPLKRRDVGAYVAHRLQIAGSPWHVGFTNRATDLVYEFSGGVPRSINLLCDRALEAGCDALTPCITPELVLEAAETAGAQGCADEIAAATMACVGCGSGGDVHGGRCRGWDRNRGGALPAVPVRRLGAPARSAQARRPGIGGVTGACAARRGLHRVRVNAC